MASDELQPNSYALIGMLCLRGPSTPYELKKAMAHIGREFWAVSHTQHYKETARLERLGMLASTQEPEGRRRRVYEATDKGRSALRDWLSAPTPVSLELRDVALLKLFLSELADERDIVQLARTQMDLYRERLAALDHLEELFADRPEKQMRLAVVPFGRALYSGALEFWSNIAAAPPTRARQSSAGATRPRSEASSGGGPGEQDVAGQERHVSR
jgi:DNA-binding PadR family transcriptional regulator